VITWGAVSLILFTPLAVGSVEPWGFASMEVITFLLVALWLLKHLVVAEPRTPERGIYQLVLPAALFVALVAFQIAPLPPSFEAIISPSTFELYQKSLPGWPDRPVYGESLPAGSHPGGLALLPSSAEVAGGAEVPFGKIDKQNTPATTRKLKVENRPGPRWRPLSVDNSLTGPALLKLVQRARGLQPTPGRRREPHFAILLTDLPACSECGGPMVPGSDHDHDPEMRAWYCSRGPACDMPRLA